MMRPLQLVLALGLICSARAETGPVGELPPGAPLELAHRLQGLLQRTGQAYEVDIRITSRGPDGGSPSVARLVASRSPSPSGDRLRFRLDAGGESHRYCLDCTPAGGARPCPETPVVPIPSGSDRLTGTLLPWEEVLVGACGTWKVEPLETRPESKGTPGFEVRLTPTPVGLSWTRTLAEVDPVTGTPIRFERLDGDGRIVRGVKVLEVGRVASWVGIRRAIVEVPDGKVLMEIRGVHLGGPAIDPMAQ